MYDACTMHVKNGDKRTDGKLNSRSRMQNPHSLLCLVLLLISNDQKNVTEDYLTIVLVILTIGDIDLVHHHVILAAAVETCQCVLL